MSQRIKLDSYTVPTFIMGALAVVIVAEAIYINSKLSSLSPADQTRLLTTHQLWFGSYGVVVPLFAIAALWYLVFIVNQLGTGNFITNLSKTLSSLI